MSVRVNLLPRTVAERNKAARQRALAVLAGAALVAVLVLLYFVQVGRVNAVRDDLAVEQATLTQLRGQLATLQEFADLNRRVEDADAQLVAVLGSEASVAGVLQDIAAVMPSDTALQSLAVSIGNARSPGSVGAVTLTGQTLRGHAPGVERLLLSLGKVAAFRDVFVSSSTVDAGEELDVANFAVDFELGPEILTLRYVGGLPGGLR